VSLLQLVDTSFLKFSGFHCSRSSTLLLDWSSPIQF